MVAPENPDKTIPDTLIEPAVACDVSDMVGGTHELVRDVVTDAPKRIITLEENQMMLIALRDSGELSEHDFDLNDLYYLLLGDTVIEERHLGDRAIVVSCEILQEFGGKMKVKFKNGQVITFEAESMRDPTLIIFPHDLA